MGRGLSVKCLLFRSIIQHMLSALFSSLRGLRKRAKQIFSVRAARAFLQNSLIDNSQSLPQSLTAVNKPVPLPEKWKQIYSRNLGFLKKKFIMPFNFSILHIHG